MPFLSNFDQFNVFTCDKRLNVLESLFQIKQLAKEWSCLNFISVNTVFEWNIMQKAYFMTHIYW